MSSIIVRPTVGGKRPDADWRRRSVLRTAGGQVGISPDAVSGLVGWYKADALSLNDNDAVSSWTDSSGQGNHVTQAVGTKQPLFKTSIRNGKPVVRFDGIDDDLAIVTPAGFGSQTGQTIFAVFSSDNVPSNAFFVAVTTRSAFNELRLRHNPPVDEFYVWQWLIPSGAIVAAFSESSANNFNPGWVVVTGRFNDSSNEVAIWRNSVAGDSVTDSGMLTTTEIRLGSRSSNSLFWDGDIAEVCVYNNPVSNSDRLGVENHLRNKYAI